MSRASFEIRVLLSCLALVAIAGCSDAPKPPPRFEINPQQAAQEAMKLYDTNGDGALDAKELRASPPLEELLKNIQARSPGHPNSLTAADIADRLEQWLKSPAIVLPAMAVVYLDDQPLEGATVTFEPEPFLGSSYHAHQGQTNAAGNARLDPELKNFPGCIYVGLYRVRISKKVNGKETVPPRYNTQTELGREIATNLRAGASRENPIFRLKSK